MKQLKTNKIPVFEYERDYAYLESAWIGHRYFIYDLILTTKPKVVVELGTHHGGSFFSMAQAVKDSELSTQLHAVDTWQGDKHAGFYDDKVFLKVNKIKDDLYKNVNINLLKKTFDEALAGFKKDTIDILHIDGLHTYEAVKHDFENWFPKVKKDGIILFHDVLEKQKDFGVWRLWEELKDKYDYFEFINYHGLGLIFKGKKTFGFENLYQDYYPLVHELKKTYELKNEADKTIVKNKEYKDEIEKEKEILENEKSKLESLFGEYIIMEKKEKDLIDHKSNLEHDLNSLINSFFYKIWQSFVGLKKYYSNL